MLVSDDAATWRVAYGSPVDGRLVALASVAGRFYALLVGSSAGGVGGESLAVWSSDDGTQWRLDDEQPAVPVEATWFHDIAMIPAGDRLLIVAGGETSGVAGFASIALLGPYAAVAPGRLAALRTRRSEPMIAALMELAGGSVGTGAPIEVRGVRPAASSAGSAGSSRRRGTRSDGHGDHDRRNDQQSQRRGHADGIGGRPDDRWPDHERQRQECERCRQ